MKKNLKLKSQSLTSVFKYLFIGILMTIAPVYAQAQNKTISGVVTDDLKETLPGVTVTIKGSKTAAQTDVNGKFMITASPKDQLVFSYIGFETTSVLIGAKTVINVNLKSQMSDLDEVVVIGYGTTKRKDLTGAVASVTMKDLAKAPVRSFDEALAGRVAGVQVTSADGRPGSGVNIVIRGNNSVTQSSSPLYVVDGFLLEDQNNNTINPADIESIDVLKDASATAIYGARGANGVIVITTKKGKEGKPVFSFSSSTGVQENINPIEMMSPYEFVKYQIELTPELTGTPKTPTELYLADGKTLDYYKTQPAIDWQSKTQRAAIITNNNLSVSGGTKKLKYVFSGSTIDQDGILLGSNYKRYQGRTVLDYKITDKLKVGVNANYSFLKQSGVNPVVSETGSSTSNIMVAVWGARPVLTDPSMEDFFIDPDIDPLNDYRVNPVINLQNMYRVNNTKNFSANSYLEYLFTKDLKLRSTFGITENRLTQNSFDNSRTQYGNPAGSNGGPQGSIINISSSNWLNENTLTWNKKLTKKSKIDVLGGFTVQKSDRWTNGISAKRLPNEDLGLDGLYQGVQQRVDSTASVWTMSSFLGRINYNYDSRYLVTASFRADGSSKFPSENHWGYFPSAAASWTFKNEKFLKRNKVLSEGKLRVSYGVTGNNRVGDFDYLTRYFNPIGSSYVFNNQYVSGVVATNLGNSQLKWESTEQVDAGLDVGFFNQRVTISADVYRKLTKDLLLQTQLAPSSGFGTATKNVGSVENKGLELSLTTRNIQTENFSWTSSANISFNKNKVVALGEDGSSIQRSIPWDNFSRNISAYITKVGEPLGLMYGYESLGTYKYEDFTQDSNGQYFLKADVNTSGKPRTGDIRTRTQPGDPKYKDQNGDLATTTADYTVIGKGQPIHTGGFSNNFTYKGFDLNVFLQWSYGNDIMNANTLMFEGNAQTKTFLNQYASYNNRWSADNPTSDIPRTRGYNTASFGGYSSAIVEDGSFIRLKTVSLGYNFESEFTKKLRLKSLRFYLSGQNLITWTKYSGSDPEVNSYGSALTSGFDFSSYPRARTIVFGTNISF
ncbi:SusC/RagA family TonB-linked outer membrane protein [Flavobacterium sp. PL11]|uniref:SusC/RagA family TonB-linked outer membrane protein n=1 Tax=Flavobacterium sp. PL11 TaxID=3071717 RepID=UPI002E157EF0